MILLQKTGRKVWSVLLSVLLLLSALSPGLVGGAVDAVLTIT